MSRPSQPWRKLQRASEQAYCPLSCLEACPTGRPKNQGGGVLFYKSGISIDCISDIHRGKGGQIWFGRVPDIFGRRP